ncbi:hypothetical protein [Microvirga sp. P5_D2]
MALLDRLKRQGQVGNHKIIPALIGTIECKIIGKLQYQLDLYYRDSPVFSMFYANLLSAPKSMLEFREAVARDRSPSTD